MRKDLIENKERAPVTDRLVRVIALRRIGDHPKGQTFDVSEGPELNRMIALGWVRLVEGA